MPTVQDIPFRDIPRQSELFLSYLDSCPSALRFYSKAPALENICRLQYGLLADMRFTRSEIVSILRRQNESYACESETLRHINELEKPDCVAVLTGQQVGLFTGPLYTIYKALTAVGIADKLRGKGIPAVPIFWMEAEDHDLAEATRCAVYDSSSSVQIIDYRKILFEEMGNLPRPVGSIRFSEGILKAVRDYLGHLPDSVWKRGVRFLLESTYKPGATFTQAFARLLARILRGSGLILFDPHDTEAKRLTSRLFQCALRDAGPIRAALLQRNRELEAAGFQPQVSVLEKSTVLFLLEDGERHALEQRGSCFGIKNGDRVFGLEELLLLAENAPEKFSPGVLLRPIVQDHLFPTVAYVAGSSELAYFAQIEVLYRHFRRPMPVIWPRNSFTLLEPGIASIMDRLRIDIRDCFQGRQRLTEMAMENPGFSRAVDAVHKLQQRLDQALTEIRPEVQTVEPTLVQALETARRKILHNTRRLQSRIMRMEEAQNSSIPEAMDALLDNCFPNRNLQEREFSIHHFLARYGPPILDSLRRATDVENTDHRVLQLEDRDTGAQGHREFP